MRFLRCTRKRIIYLLLRSKNLAKQGVFISSKQNPVYMSAVRTGVRTSMEATPLSYRVRPLSLLPKKNLDVSQVDHVVCICTLCGNSKLALCANEPPASYQTEAMMLQKPRQKQTHFGARCNSKRNENALTFPGKFKFLSLQSKTLIFHQGE